MNIKSIILSCRLMPILWRTHQLQSRPQRRNFNSIDDLADLECLFVLSTGRCGTKLFAGVLASLPNSWVEHAPHPELAQQSYLAYKLRYDLDCLETGFLHARLDLLKHVYRAGFCYIETNNRLSLYAEAIASLLPKAKFIHLVRHPGDFIRSGMRRGYYDTMIPELSGHLEPNPDNEIFNYWHKMDRLEKIAWQWETINQEIKARTASLGPSRIKTVLSQDLFKKPETITDIMNFMGKDPLPEKTVAKHLKRPVNAQKKGKFPKYKQWPREDKEKIIKLTPSTFQYGFDL